MNVREEETETTKIELDIEDDREKDILPMIEGVQDTVKKIKNKKAPGTDTIPAELLKNDLEY